MTKEDGIKNILVIKLGALGDFVQALGPMAAIRRKHPDAKITILTTKPYAGFATSCGYFDYVWTDTKPKWFNFKNWSGLKKKLNEGAFDRVYDLQNNDRTGIYFKLFKDKPEWVGIAKGASHRNTSLQRTAGHAFDGHIQTLKLAGIDDIEIDRLDWVQGDIKHFGIAKPYVLLVPGCSPKRPEKQWPASYYAVLARTLHGWGFTPVLIGTKSEQDIAKTICEKFPQTFDLTGQTALLDIVLLARHAAAAIGNDTGPMHLVAPTGCPSYVLFSRYSNPAKHAPKGSAVKIIATEELPDLDPETVIKEINMREFRNSEKDDQDSFVSGQ